MSAGPDIGAHLRRLFGDLNTEAVRLNAALLTTIESAREILAPHADDDSPAGIAAGIAFQLLADAAADAVCPPPEA